MTTTTTDNVTVTYPSSTGGIFYCPHRLPCGYCQMLGRDCPKESYGNPITNPSITWSIPYNAPSTVTADPYKGVTYTATTEKKK
jgi:hypothetical protein